MSAVWGRKVRYTIFGESHGGGIGMVIDGLPAGTELDWQLIEREMARRAPGKSPLTTPRSEKDSVTICSGLYRGKTDGSPLCALIGNTDTRSADYAAEPHLFRPGHADYTAFVKTGGHNDPRGGGHFSGRLTAPLVFAGAIARQLLAPAGIVIGAHIARIGTVEDAAFDPAAISSSLLAELNGSSLPVLNGTAADAMRREIAAAAAAGDSVGGVVEAAATGLPAGTGEPFFDSLESTLAHLVFSIPAVKGIEFGSGFQLAAMRGSQANDSFVVNNGKVQTVSNHHGGVLGGIASGMPLVLRVAFKPTPSIAKPQDTVNAAGEAAVLNIKGRHDPCVVPRAVPVVEAAIALAVWDML
ncbi:MAG: chorismate synthase [Sporomusaceae bacterium]|nr:chorismate synthase [Sporomusaceae bacterium]